MSDCSDMTSQLARELTKGIRDEVEDVAAMYSKMAVIKESVKVLSVPEKFTQMLRRNVK